VKIYLGQQMDEMTSGSTTTKWEDNTPDRVRPVHPFLANWYKKAVTKALQRDAKRKYFEHAGALLTGDGRRLRRPPDQARGAPARGVV
jgi:hypothetical protein